MVLLDIDLYKQLISKNDKYHSIDIKVIIHLLLFLRNGSYNRFYDKILLKTLWKSYFTEQQR